MCIFFPSRHVSVSRLLLIDVQIYRFHYKICAECKAVLADVDFKCAKHYKLAYQVLGIRCRLLKLWNGL